MANTAVLGCIWGDEAKAKIVDFLAAEADIVIRYQGGNNAGHTIVSNGKKYIFHLIPAGILYPDKICFLGNGVVIDLFALLAEMENLSDQGICFQNRFFIDPRAGIVLPIHRQLDETAENDSPTIKIGTTKRGIGPCYSDLTARVGIRFGDLFHLPILRQRLKRLYNYHKLSDYDTDDLAEALYLSAKPLAVCQQQISYFLNRHQDKRILFEGAQGALLDLSFGTYPFVTSSHTTIGGITTGSGFSLRRLDRVVGVYKSYFTRVGEGPFPTELKNEIGDTIREHGNEYGSTTGRPRRCGWFDAVAARYSAMLNDIDEIALTLLDVLSGLDSIKICTGYRLGETVITDFPDNSEILSQVTPIYEDLKGWKDDITRIRSYRSLPQAAREYIGRLEELLKRKITIISVGPAREQTIIR